MVITVYGAELQAEDVLIINEDYAEIDGFIDEIEHGGRVCFRYGVNFANGRIGIYTVPMEMELRVVRDEGPHASEIDPIPGDYVPATEAEACIPF